MDGIRAQAVQDFDLWSNVDYVGLFIILMIGFLACVLIFWLFNRYSKGSIKAMEELSRNYNGEIINGSFISGKQTGLTFEYNDFSIMISSAYRGKGEISYTQIEATFKEHKDIFLHIYKKSIVNYLKQWYNILDSRTLEEIETGYSDFDKNFTVKSIDGSFFHNMLTSSIITYLCQIKQFNPNIIIDKGKIILWLPIVFNKKRDYESLINIVFLLCNRLKELNFA